MLSVLKHYIVAYQGSGVSSQPAPSNGQDGPKPLARKMN